MSCPKDHKPYASRADAFAAMMELVKDAKRTGKGGRSFKRLRVFPCGNHFHFGRANKLPKSYAKPKAKRTENLPTFGEARRKLAKLDRDLERTIDYLNHKRAEYIARLVEMDRRLGHID